jgi:hypothetical protein
VQDLITMGVAGKYANCTAQIAPANSTQRTVAIASYLLAQHSMSSFSAIDYANVFTSAQYWPEYTVEIGQPVTPNQSLASLLHVSGLYVRPFTGGLVLVNPTGAGIDYTVGTATKSLGFTGGGQVSALGVTDAALTYTDQSSVVTVPANGALILQYPSTALSGCTMSGVSIR